MPQRRRGRFPTALRRRARFRVWTSHQLMAGNRKRARKKCGRKRSRAQKGAGSRRKNVRKSTAPALTSVERRRKRYADDANYRDKVAATRLKREYGITPEEYAAMLKRQKGRCAICRRKFRYRLGVDHCAVRHTIRGLLCLPCNLGLGNFRDRPALLRRAAKYLERAVRNAKKLPRLRAIPAHDKARRPGQGARHRKATSPPARTRRSVCRRVDTNSRRCARTSA